MTNPNRQVFALVAGALVGCLALSPVAAAGEDSPASLRERRQRIHNLARRGPPAGPALAHVLRTDPDPDVRLLAAVTLRDFAPELPLSVLAGIGRSASDASAPVRRVVAETITFSERPCPSAVASLLKNLSDDEDGAARAAAGRALGVACVRYGGGNAGARTRAQQHTVSRGLLDAIFDDDARVRLAALEALGALSPPPKVRLEGLGLGLEDRLEPVRLAALLLASDAGPAGMHPALPMVLSALEQSESRTFRRTALEALLDLSRAKLPRHTVERYGLPARLYPFAGPDAAAAERALALQTLGHLGMKDARTDELVLAGLEAQAAEVTRAATWAAGKLLAGRGGEAGGRLVMRLVELLRRTPTREHATILGALRQSGRLGVRALSAGLDESENRHATLLYAKALLRLSPGDPRPVVALSRLLPETPARELPSLVRTLTQLGARARPAAAPLAAALGRVGSTEQEQILRALKRLGRGGAAARANLFAALDRGLGTTRLEALALETIAALATPAGAASVAAMPPGAIGLPEAAMPGAEPRQAASRPAQPPNAGLARAEAAAIVGRIGSTAPAVRLAAIRCGAAYRIAAARAPLLAYLIDPRTASSTLVAVCEAIGPLAGPEAVPALVALLDRPESKVAHAAVRALGELGPIARPALPKVLALCDRERKRADATDESRLELAATAAALGRLGAPVLAGKGAASADEGAAALPASTRTRLEKVLVALLAHPRPVKQAAAVALGRVEARSKPAIRKLLAFARSGGTDMQAAAVGALGHVTAKEHQDEVTSLCTELLWNTSLETQRAAATTLSRIGKPAEAALKSYFEGHYDAEVRRLALQGLLRIGSSALDGNVDALIECLALPDPELQALALAGIQSAAAREPDVLRDLTKRLEEASVRQVMIAIGAPCVPLLVRRLRHLRSAQRMSSAMLLGRMGPVAIGSVPALLERLRDRRGAVRNAAAWSVSKILAPGPASGEGVAASPVPPKVMANAVAALVERLEEEPEAGVRIALLEALGALGVHALEADEAVEDSLDAKLPRERAAAGVALIRLHEAAPAEALALLGDDESQVRLKIVRALGTLGAAGAPYRDALKSLADDPSAKVKRAAALALEAIDAGER